MTDDWDFYFLQVDDQPASIYVDLGARAAAPVAGLPHMAYVRLRMRDPRDDGLSSREEFDTLVAIEDALSAALVGAGTGYVGRCTTNGCRDFFYYVADPGDWPARVAACLQAFPAYEHEAGTQPDPDWSTYLSYLHPSDADSQTIQNRRVCEALQSQGDTLSVAREIDHWAYFPAEADRDAFVAEALALGFQLRQSHPPEEPGDAWCAQVWRADIPAADAIDGITLPLFELAELHGGDYDGWESVVVRQ
jgi:regulator of RNase E activity RraB